MTWAAAKLFLKGALGGLWALLKAIPWQVWAITAVLLIGWRWHSNAVTEAVSVAVKAEQSKCKSAAVAELKKATAAAEKSRVEWAEKLAKREAEIGKFKAGLDAQAETFKAELASSERVAQKLSKELYDYVRIHPMGTDCTLSPELQRLRSEQIREANERPNRPAG